jgi:hypothetical protein
MAYIFITINVIADAAIATNFSTTEKRDDLKYCGFKNKNSQ